MQTAEEKPSPAVVDAVADVVSPAPPPLHPIELAPKAPPPKPLAEPSVGALVQLAIERGIDPAALQTMMDVYERIAARSAKAEFDAAMAAFQAECPQVPKTKTATITSKRTSTQYKYTYAPIDQIDRTIAPHLHKHGLSYTFDSEVSQDGQFLKAICLVQHEGGHSQTSSFTCPIDTASKDPRNYGIARSYACRYALVQALGIATADPDPDGTAQETAALTIDDAQRAEIVALLKETGADEQTFLDAIDAPSLDAIPVGAVHLAVSMLKTRAKKIKGAQT